MGQSSLLKQHCLLLGPLSAVHPRPARPRHNTPQNPKPMPLQLDSVDKIDGVQTRSCTLHREREKKHLRVSGRQICLHCLKGRGGGRIEEDDKTCACREAQTLRSFHCQSCAAHATFGEQRGLCRLNLTQERDLSLLRLARNSPPAVNAPAPTDSLLPQSCALGAFPMLGSTSSS